MPPCWSSWRAVRSPSMKRSIASDERRVVVTNSLPSTGGAMSTERKQVLEMLAEGKITTEDADRLLDKLGGSPGATGNAGASAENKALPPRAPKFLRVVVDS